MNAGCKTNLRGRIYFDVAEYWLKLVVYGDDDSTPAVEALRKKYEDWKMKEKTGARAPGDEKKPNYSPVECMLPEERRMNVTYLG